MAKRKDMSPMKWVMCLLALVAVVLAALILNKVSKKCTKDGYTHRRVGMDDPGEIGKLAMQHCATQDKELLNNFQTVMKLEDKCQQGQLWDDSSVINGVQDPPGGTDDDNVMMYLCNALVTYRDIADNVVVNTNMVPLSKKHFPEQVAKIECALKNPNDLGKCC
jgi:hypothetical protein